MATLKGHWLWYKGTWFPNIPYSYLLTLPSPPLTTITTTTTTQNLALSIKNNLNEDMIIVVVNAIEAIAH